MENRLSTELELKSQIDQKPFQVLVQGEVVYETDSVRDCQMFYAELLGRLYLSGAQQQSDHGTFDVARAIKQDNTVTPLT